jgi:hypothetical protein
MKAFEALVPRRQCTKQEEDLEQVEGPILLEFEEHELDIIGNK